MRLTFRRFFTSTLLFCALLLAPFAAIAASFTTAVTGGNPVSWSGYSSDNIHVPITVTNTGATAAAITLYLFTPKSGVGNGGLSAPSPTLPLNPGQSGTITAYIDFGASPTPPAAGNYDFDLQFVNTVDGSSVTQRVTIARSYPTDGPNGTLSGRILDAVTGVALTSGITIRFADPNSARSVTTSPINVTPQGYTTSLLPGTYWVYADAAGYKTKYVSNVVVTPGQATTLDFQMTASSVTASAASPSFSTDAGQPLYSASANADATRIAVEPGFPSPPTAYLQMYDNTATLLWKQSIASTSSAQYDVPEWTSYDGKVKLSPDGRRVALGTRAGTIAVYDAATGAPVWSYSGTGDVNPRVPGPLGMGVIRSSEIQFSPDGTQLAGGALSGYAYVFDPATGAVKWKFATAGQVRALGYSPDGATLYVGSGDETLYALNAADGTQRWAAALTFWPWEHIAVTRDGTRVATGGKDGVVRVFNAATGTLVWSYSAPSFIQGYDFSADGQDLIVTVGGGNGIYDFDPTGAIKWYRRDQNPPGAPGVFFDPTGRYVGECLNAGGPGLAAQVLTMDGTPVWKYTVAATTSCFQMALTPTRLIVTSGGATGDPSNPGGKLAVFDNWLSASATSSNLFEGAVFSTAQAATQSFLRFFNTGTAAGTVSATLYDYASGQSLGTWTSPSIAAGAEQQFDIGTVERGAAITTKPNYYSVSIQTGLSGYFQHVLYRPADGTLTNSSTCGSGVGVDSTEISGVHTSLLAIGYPSSIVVSNTGLSPAPVTLGIYDARDGSKLGAYTTLNIAGSGQSIISIATLEAGAHITPTAGMYHYVIKVESAFTGFLQHLVNNTQVAVITDMTTSCALSGRSPSVATTPLLVDAVFSSAQTSSQSFLRFFNTSSAAGTVTVGLRDAATGTPLGNWTSPSIAPASEQQFPISTLEAVVAGTKPSYYAISIQTSFTGYFQHVLYRPADGTLTNLSTCGSGVSASGAWLAGVHSSLLSTGFPSSLVINNTATTAEAVTLAIYDARSGVQLGTYTSPSIPANGQIITPAASIEAAAGITPTAGMYHYVIHAQGTFTGYLQNLVNNTQVGVITDMTTSCTLTH